MRGRKNLKTDDVRRVLHDLFVSFLTAARLGKEEDSIIIKQFNVMYSPPIDILLVYQFRPEWMERPPSIWFD